MATRGGVRNLHPDPVATTWRMAFERIKKANPAAADLLRLCAFLAPEEIPEQLITLGEVELTGPLKKLARSSNKLNTAIRELQKYSLIARDALAQTLTVHRLVQAVLRDQMPKNTAYAWAVRTMRTMYHVFPWPTVENWNLCQQLLPHARECAALITQWKITMIEGAILLYNMSSYLDDRGIYDEAEVYCKRVLEIESKLFGQGNVLTANTLNNLGMVYYNQGKYDKAKELHQQALAIRRKVLDENDPEIARSLNNLANIYDDQGDYQKAEQLYTQTLAIRYKVLGEEHPDTLTSLNNLADVFLNRGNYEEAEKRYQQALTIRKRILREDHPDIAVSLNSLANAYQQLGRFKEAEMLLQQAVAIDQRVLGEEHIATAITLTNLAHVYANLDQYEEAKTLFQQALAIYLTEEFVSVYRMHPLLPDEFIFRSTADDQILLERALPEVADRHAREVAKQVSMTDLFYSFGTSNPGAITLHNYPRHLQRRIEPDGSIIDLATTEILRDRERGVPRYNEFRRLVHRPPLTSFEELTVNKTWVEELRRVYNNDIEQVDLMIGMYAEYYSDHPPQGFGFSDTAFRIFIVMASRRLNSDRFFTTDYNPTVYSKVGFDWVVENDMTTVLLRHFPALEPMLTKVKNPFAPWPRAKS